MTALLDHPWGLLLTATMGAFVFAVIVTGISLGRAAAKTPPTMPHPVWTPEALARLDDAIWLFDATEFIDTQHHLDMWETELEAS